MIKKAVAIMVYSFGFLGIFTAAFFYVQPNDFGNMIMHSMPALYNFLLYYFIISGGISFFIVGIGGGLCIAKKISFENAKFGIFLNLISLACYMVFGFLV